MVLYQEFQFTGKYNSGNRFLLQFSLFLCVSLSAASSLLPALGGGWNGNVTSCTDRKHTVPIQPHLYQHHLTTTKTHTSVLSVFGAMRQLIGFFWEKHRLVNWRITKVGELGSAHSKLTKSQSQFGRVFRMCIQDRTSRWCLHSSFLPWDTWQMLFHALRLSLSMSPVLLHFWQTKQINTLKEKEKNGKSNHENSQTQGHSLCDPVWPLIIFQIFEFRLQFLSPALKKRLMPFNFRSLGLNISFGKIIIGLLTKHTLTLVHACIYVSAL